MRLERSCEMRNQMIDTKSVQRKPKHQRVDAVEALTTQLARDFRPESIKAAIIRYWAERQNISVSGLEKGRHVGSMLHEDCERPLRVLQRVGGFTALKDVERAFEFLMDSDHKREHGTVYTPDYIIDYLLIKGLEIAKPENIRQVKICDPSCGSGAFLLRAAEILHLQYGISQEHSFSELLTGIDRDPIAVAQCSAIIEMYLVQKRFSLGSIQPRVFLGDALFGSTDVANDKYNVIATNPPYVKLQNLAPDYRARLLDRYSHYVSGNFSLSLLFLLRAYELLEERGCVAFITQNNLYTSLAGERLRAHLQQEQCIRRIVDFGHRQIFENASAYTCLIFLGKEKYRNFDFVAVADASAGSLEAARFSIISTSGLDPHKWRLASPQHLKNLRCIESIGRPLGELVQIKVGFATLKDSVFFVQQSEDGVCTGTLPDQSRAAIEFDATKGAVRIADFDSEKGLATNRRRIIFPYRRNGGGRFEIIDEHELESLYPLAYEYLGSWKSELAKRDKGKLADPWFAWGRTQALEAPGPKLLTKTFSAKPAFYLDGSDQLFCNGYALFCSKGTLFEKTYDLRLVQKIVNSPIMHYYAKLTSFEIEGNFQCYQKNFIERFGVPDLSDSEQYELMQIHGNAFNRRLAALYGVSLDVIAEVIEIGS